jgi:hypothetical protein
MVVSIHQPNYFPWLGYFYKIYKSETFVFLDDAQFSSKGMHNYHYLKTPQGPYRLKIPVKGDFGDKIDEILTRDDLKWREKHLKTIELNYRSAPFFDEVFIDLQKWILAGDVNLARQNEWIILNICERFGIKTLTVKSSDLSINSLRGERIIEICKRTGASEYLSGTGARAYQDEKEFEKNGILLSYSEFTPFVYPQLWGKYISNVSVIDYLMNCGYNWERVIENQKK